jgi:AcrR family transcriptional regulator
MSNQNYKELIKTKAVEIFSEKGFHGTSIRDIARLADCSLPMLYYYYNNKNDLFEEIVYKEFLLIIDRLNQDVPRELPIEETYFSAIKQRKELSKYDKDVYKMALKVWLGFEGNSDIRKKLQKWEKDRQERTRKILSQALGDRSEVETLASLMVRIMENMIEKIILLDEDIPDEQLRMEINVILRS